MAAIFREGKFFLKLQGLHSLDTLWVENFDEIALSRTVFSIQNSQLLIYLPVPRSVTPMGNVTKYLQKLGMGVYDNENQPGV